MTSPDKTPCPSCNCDGYVDATPTSIRGGPPDSIPCPACDGLGHLDIHGDFEVCVRCYGDGFTEEVAW